MVEFFKDWEDKMGKRYKAFNLFFNLLYDKQRPVNILETGTIRRANNWRDGQSTLIFGRFVNEVTQGQVETIDINPVYIELCKKVTKKFAHSIIYTVGDSLTVLENKPATYINKIDLFYLDSYDLNIKNPAPSQLHHLNETNIIFPNINPGALIAVDDNTPEYGKGQSVREYLGEAGWEQLNETADYVWIFAKKE